MILSRLTVSFGQVAVFIPGIQSLIIDFGKSVFFLIGPLYRPWLVLRIAQSSFRFHLLINKPE